MHSEPGKRVHAERQQRFTNMKPRKFLALENHDAATSAREQRRGGAAGRSAAHNSGVICFRAHRSLMLANFPRFGRRTAHTVAGAGPPVCANVCSENETDR